eukprot:Nk52_evm28s163 gene=Nk52_evmTU28s163
MEAFDHINDFLYDSLFASFAAHYNGDHQDKEDHYIRRRRGCLLQRYRAYKGRQSMRDIEKGKQSSLKKMKESLENARKTGELDDVLKNVIPEKYQQDFLWSISFIEESDANLYFQSLEKIVELRSDFLVELRKTNPDFASGKTVKAWMETATAMTDANFKLFLKTGIKEESMRTEVLRRYKGEVDDKIEEAKRSLDFGETLNHLGETTSGNMFRQNVFERLPLRSEEDVEGDMELAIDYMTGDDWRTKGGPLMGDPSSYTPGPPGDVKTTDNPGEDHGGFDSPVENDPEAGGREGVPEGVPF